MNSLTRSYKYSCRTCSIRGRCIDDKAFGPGLKLAIENRFANHTDTFETWDMLQEDCLLIRLEQQTAADKLQSDTGLGRRLRQARQSAQAPPSLDAHVPAREAEPKLTGLSARLQPPPQEPARPSAPRRTSSSRAIPCGLAVLASDRLVRLPDGGEVVLGRFVHGFSNPPDVDLTLADGEVPSVSRRHALVTGRAGRHWIEDMGSSNGTYVNGHRLPLGKSVELAPKDRLLLGRCRLVYSPLAKWMLEPDPRVPHTAFLTVTHTGHRIKLPNKEEIVVGRPDPSLDYVPDVDLSIAGDIARYVSRRHVRFNLRSGWHFLEEGGSAAGTRINGRPIGLGEPAVMLRHGDQLWLSGCVVAYEWKLS